jgi:hypothetical protein
MIRSGEEAAIVLEHFLAFSRGFDRDGLGGELNASTAQDLCQRERRAPIGSNLLFFSGRELSRPA